MLKLSNKCCGTPAQTLQKTSTKFFKNLIKLSVWKIAPLFLKKGGVRGGNPPLTLSPSPFSPSKPSKAFFLTSAPLVRLFSFSRLYGPPRGQKRHTLLHQGDIPPARLLATVLRSLIRSRHASLSGLDLFASLRVVALRRWLRGDIFRPCLCPRRGQREARGASFLNRQIWRGSRQGARALPKAMRKCALRILPRSFPRLPFRRASPSALPLPFAEPARRRVRPRRSSEKNAKGESVAALAFFEREGTGQARRLRREKRQGKGRGAPPPAFRGEVQRALVLGCSFGC